jgi:DNA-binding SARP family transcriptional activator
MQDATIQLLGDVSVSAGVGARTVVRGAQPRATLTLLVMERGRSVSRHEVADLLWGGRLPAHWTGAVRGVVAKVRAAIAGLEAQGVTLSTNSEGWRVDVAPEASVDLHTAMGLLEAAEREAEGATPADAARAAWDAAKLLAGELAPGATGDWLDRHRHRLEHRRRRALALAAELGTDSGRTDIAVPAAEALAALDPYDERAALLLAGALARGGDRRAARAALVELARRLRHDLDAEVSEEVVAMERRLDTGERPVARTSAMSAPRPVLAMFGRDLELAELWSQWQSVAEHRRARLAVVEGEPGSGKTRLAAELAGEVHREGATLLWTHCSPDRGLSFEPVVQAVGRLRGDDPFGSARAGAPSWDSARLSELYQATTTFLRAALDRPTLWVLDDLQWANGDTAGMLSHLAGTLPDLPVHLVVATRGHDAPVAETLSNLSRNIPSVHVPLSGLDLAGVTAMLAEAGIAHPDQIGEEVLERTGGNPFFITQLLGERDATGRIDPSALPPSVRSWLGHRLDTLPSAAADVLAAAAVWGMQVDVSGLAAVTDADPLAIAGACDVLVSQRFLTETAEDGRLAFSHAITQEAVYDRIGAIRRQLLHAATAKALDAREDADLASLAHHLSRSGSHAHRDPVEVLLAAGDLALSQAAWTTARHWFDLAEQHSPESSLQRVLASIGAGHARRGLGDRRAGRKAFESALTTAQALPAPRQVAEATLGLVGGGARGVADDLPDDRRAALLEAALDGLGPDDDDLAVPLQLELALALLLTDEVDRRDHLAVDAVARARGLERPDLVGSALLGSRIAQIDPCQTEERLAVVDEVLGIPAPHRSPELTVRALVARHEDALLCGDRRLAREALSAAEHVVTDHDHPYWRWVVATWGVLDQVIDGALDAAESAAFAAAELQADHPESLACLGVNLVDIRLFQGRAGEVIDLLGAAADDNPQIPCYRAVLALCLAEAGDLARARQEFEFFARHEFANVPRDTNRLLTLAVLADVAATLEERDAAPALVELLAPHRPRHVVLNCYAGGGSYWGPVATQLGRLARLLDAHDDADRLLEEATSSAEAFGAPLARARVPHR